MKKLFFNWFKQLVIPVAIIIFFYTPNLVLQRIPIPADTLVGLYHPWRDNSYFGFSPESFPVKNPLITDPILQTYPWRRLVIDNLNKFEIPLWNPYSFSGQPLLANIQSATFQVFNVFFLLIPFNQAWALTIIVPHMLAGVFMYIFIKSLKLSSTAAAFGAIAFSFSAFVIAWLTWGTIITTAMWFPLALYLVNTLYSKVKASRFMLFTFVIFQIVVSGHIQTALYLIIGIFSFCLYQLKLNRKLRSFTLQLTAMLLGLLISSIQLIPSIELTALSNRQNDQNYFVGRTDWFIPYQNLIQIVAPDVYGNPSTQNYFGVWNYAEFVSYIGIIPLSFVILSLLILKKKTAYFCGLLLVSIILAIDNPISRLIYTLNIPFISTMQPSRIIFLIGFSLIILSTYGLEHLLTYRKKIINLLPAFFLILCVIFIFVITSLFTQEQKLISQNNLKLPFILTCLTLFLTIATRFKIDKKIIISIIFAFTIFDLFRFSYKFTPFTDLNNIYPQTEILSFLANQEKPFRVMSQDRRILTPNSGTPFKIESVSGYDPLYIKKYAELISSIENKKVTSDPQYNRILTPQSLDQNLLRILNVKYVLSFENIGSKDFEKIMDEGSTKLYVYKNYLPRFYFPDEVIKTNNYAATLEKIINEDKIDSVAYSEIFSTTNKLNTNEISLVKYTDNKIELNTKTDNDAHIVISNINYPGWKAYVNGESREIKTVNAIFQSIFIPSGVNNLTLIYFPETFKIGLLVTIVATLMTLIITIYLWRKQSV